MNKLFLYFYLALVKKVKEKIWWWYPPVSCIVDFLTGISCPTSFPWFLLLFVGVALVLLLLLPLYNPLPLLCWFPFVVLWRLRRNRFCSILIFTLSHKEGERSVLKKSYYLLAWQLSPYYVLRQRSVTRTIAIYRKWMHLLFHSVRIFSFVASDFFVAVLLITAVLIVAASFLLSVNYTLFWCCYFSCLRLFKWRNFCTEKWSENEDISQLTGL